MRAPGGAMGAGRHAARPLVGAFTVVVSVMAVLYGLLLSRVSRRGETAPTVPPSSAAHGIPTLATNRSEPLPGGLGPPRLMWAGSTVPCRH
jgi:hypothetical protein